jgi:putative endonuclease
MAKTEYSVYILRCADDTYYTGISADVERRIAEHEGSPRGAKYLKGPLHLELSTVSRNSNGATRKR